MAAQHIEDRIGLVLGGQPFPRGRGVASGLTRGCLGQLIRRGAVRTLLHGVYVDARVEDDLGLRAAAVSLVLPPGAVLARRSAAWLHGIDTRAPSEQHQPLPLECVVPIGMTPPRRAGLQAYVTTLLPHESTCVSGVPVTTLIRTALDLTRYLDTYMGLAVVDTMLHRGLVQHRALVAEVTRFPGERWIDRARRVVDLAEPATESYGESWLRLRVVDAGLPRPRPQVEIRDRSGDFVARADLADPRRRLAIEYDGREHHSSEAAQVHDLLRRAAMTAAGWRVLVATRNEVLGRSMLLEQARGEAYGLPVTLRRRTW